MTRPDNVRCDTCVFWRALCRDPEDNCGDCMLEPHVIRVGDDQYCRHWSDTWPGYEEKTDDV